MLFVDLVYQDNSNGFLDDNFEHKHNVIWSIREDLVASQSHIGKYIVSIKELIAVKHTKYKFHYKDMFYTPEGILKAKGDDRYQHLVKSFRIFSSTNKIKDYLISLDRFMNPLDMKLPLDLNYGYYYSCCIFQINYNESKQRMMLKHFADVVWNSKTKEYNIVRQCNCCAPVNEIISSLKSACVSTMIPPKYSIDPAFLK